MTKNLLREKIGNWVKGHPLWFSIALLLLASCATRYLLIALGLYFWVSYLLLALALSVGSIALGWSIQKNVSWPKHLRPVALLGMALLPVLIALIDLTLLHTVGKLMGTVATNLINISNQAIWRMTPEGQSYLYRERWIGSDQLWLGVTLYMFLLFGLSVLVREVKSRILQAA